ncbi:hypothetical protein ACP4OV_027936 [Aristida adscensionis]
MTPYHLANLKECCRNKDILDLSEYECQRPRIKEQENINDCGFHVLLHILGYLQGKTYMIDEALVNKFKKELMMELLCHKNNICYPIAPIGEVVRDVNLDSHIDDSDSNKAAENPKTYARQRRKRIFNPPTPNCVDVKTKVAYKTELIKFDEVSLTGNELANFFEKGEVMDTKVLTAVMKCLAWHEHQDGCTRIFIPPSISVPLLNVEQVEDMDALGNMFKKLFEPKTARKAELFLCLSIPMGCSTSSV